MKKMNLLSCFDLNCLSLMDQNFHLLCSLLFLFFKGWQWTKQRATLLHRALLAQHAWPSDSRPRQRGPDPGTEVRSREDAISLPCCAGHRPGSGSHSEALGFGHRPSVCDGRKRQRSGLQLAVCGQCHGGSACRVSRMSYCNLFFAALMYSSVIALISGHNRRTCMKFNWSLSVVIWHSVCVFIDSFVILYVMARDEDEGENGRVSYRIQTGNSAGRFTLNPNTGELIFRVRHSILICGHVTLMQGDSGGFPINT